MQRSSVEKLLELNVTRKLEALLKEVYFNCSSAGWEMCEVCEFFGKGVFHCRDKCDNDVDKIVNCLIDRQSGLVMCKKCRKPVY